MSVIDEFEEAFQACLAPFTNPSSSHVFDNDELKANADNIQRFLDISRQIESNFIHKRAIVANLKPELILAEEINELKMELQRKELLLSKYNDKLSKWCTIINDTSAKKMPTLGMGTMIGVGPGGSGPGPMMSTMRPMNIAALNQMKMPAGGGNPAAMMHPGPGGPMMNQMARPPNVSMVGSPMQFNSQPPPNAAQQQAASLQGPLAYLERTTSNIGIHDNRR